MLYGLLEMIVVTSKPVFRIFDVASEVSLSHERAHLKQDYDMSRFMSEPTFCICKSKDTDQLHGKLGADQHLSFF